MKFSHSHPKVLFGSISRRRLIPGIRNLPLLPEDFVQKVLAVIRKHKLEKRIILQSFDFRTLHAMKKLAPEIELSALISGPVKSYVEVAKESGAQIISPEFHSVTPELVKAAHEAKLQVVAWTANQPAEWDLLLAAGVDAIISDDPAGLIAHLKSTGRY